jgi:hypothetical protein
MATKEAVAELVQALTAQKKECQPEITGLIVASTNEEQRKVLLNLLPPKEKKRHEQAERKRKQVVRQRQFDAFDPLLGTAGLRTQVPRAALRLHWIVYRAACEYTLIMASHWIGDSARSATCSTTAVRATASSTPRPSTPRWRPLG